MSFEQSRLWLQRALAATPNGVFGHYRTYAFAGNSQAAIPAQYPHFVARAEGCRFWDVDGNEYIDYLCGYGPMVVGYRNPEVERAVREQLDRGICHDFPSESYVELAELMVRTQKGAEWTACALNGSDALHLALLIARAHTERSEVVVASGAFHGNQSWCSRGTGRIDEDLAATRWVPWGDGQALEEMLSRGTAAAVVLCPYEQLVGAANRMPPEGYWHRVRQLCNSHGTMLLIDDVRSGFRLHPLGSCAHFDIDPDLVCVSKAIANGHPLACVLGREALRPAAESVFMSGTFWGYAPALAAALATQKILREEDGIDWMQAMGLRLTRGLSQIAADAGLALEVSGPPALPLVCFRSDRDYLLMQTLAQELALRGSFVHPTHNWFLSTAHREADIDRTLAHARGAIAAVSRCAAELGALS